MPQVARDDIPLADEEAIRAILVSLRLPQQYPEPVDREKHPAVTAHWDALPYWGRYLDDGVTTQKWTGQDDVWLTANEADGFLRRVVICGLKDEKEARLLRIEAARLRHATGTLLTAADIARLSEELTSDPERARREYQELFRYHLLRTHLFFAWSDGEVVETDGFILPISRSGLRQEDIELLRQVFTRLPPATSKLTEPGSTSGKRSPVKDLKTAREKVKQHGAEVADEGFRAWVAERLRAPDAKWTRSTPLYEDYARWIRQHGGNRGERGESKRTALLPKKWGEMMCSLYDRRRDGRGNLYRVLLKGAAGRQGAGAAP